MATPKEIRKAHRVLKTLDEKLNFLKEHYENEGYKFNHSKSSNQIESLFRISKNEDSLDGESYNGRLSIGYGGYKYVTINGIMERIEKEFTKRKTEGLKKVSLSDLKEKFLQTLNHCGLGVSFSIDNIYGYSAPISKTVQIGADRETNITITVSQTGEPQFSTRSTLPKAFLAAAEFIPDFKETWMMAQL